MPLAVWLLGACWRPEPWTPPPAPDEAVDALAEEGDAEPEEAPAAEEPDAPQEESAAAEEPEEPPAAPYQPWEGRILRVPATLVDDTGKPVSLVHQAGTVVEVRAAEPIRAKVYCATCRPPAEGWIQIELVEPTAK